MLGVSDDQIRESRESSIRDLNSMIPRRVRLNPDGGYSSLALILFFLGSGVLWGGGLCYHDVQQSRHREALNRGGREATARITRISGKTLYAHYTFPFDGKDYHGEAELDHQVVPKWPDGRTNHVRENQLIPVLFLPSDPSVNHPSGWAWWSWWDLPPYLFMLFISSIGVVGLGVVYRERRLARIGLVTEGKVIACAPKGKRFRVDYEFFNENHEQFDGANDYSDEYESGSNIRVIYLRKNPKRNDTYPLSSFQTSE